MRLSDLKSGEKGVIVKVLGHGAFRKRVIEMGFIKGKVVTAVMNAPLNDPIKYKILDYDVSLRRKEAEMIEIMPLGDTVNDIPSRELSSIEAHPDEVRNQYEQQSKVINVALVGNPNCGKTSLFNVASDAKEHVGNYSGVTVEAKKGVFKYNGYTFNIFDLPGTYSLTAYSPEERYVRKQLFEELPDVIINVVAASNLERNLYLTTQLIDMDMRMVIALNMYDELQKSGAILDYKQLEVLLGTPIVPTVSKYSKGIDNLFDTVIQVYENKNPIVRHIHINHGPVVEKAIYKLKEAIKSSDLEMKQFSPRYLAIKLLERDAEIEKILSKNPDYPKWVELRDSLDNNVEKVYQEDIESVITDAKYGFITGALKETYTPGRQTENIITRHIDEVVTGKAFGFPIFLLVIWVMFQATFSLGQHPMDWIESIVNFISGLFEKYMPPGPLHDLIVDGIIGGVGGVIIFLPNIMILYFFISFMEDSGYMARVAFIMDKIMHRMGLHGKSFIPLVMGFGCTVPSIMSARTIEDPKSRLITMLINPLISCSARLPIYILLIGTFFPNHATIALLIIYSIGVILAVLMAKLFHRFMFKGEDTPFVMELPPYRLPTLKSTLTHMWHKAYAYLSKMGGIILVASVIIWFLSYFPRTTAQDPVFDEQIEALQAQYDIDKEMPVLNQDSLQDALEHAIGHIEAIKEINRQKNSYIGKIGVFFEPIFEPLGFNWKINVALISGVGAKELIVSTLGVLYTDDVVYEETDDAFNEQALSRKLKDINPMTGEPNFTPLIAVSFIIFVLIYFPCIATITAITKESGSIWWGLFTILYTTLLAWVTTFIVYQILIRIF